MQNEKRKYYVSDPCYVIKKEHWDEYVNKILDAEKKTDFEGFITVDGHDLFAHYTRFGDGYYSSNLPGRSFSVDSGTIGCVPIELCKDEGQIQGDFYEIELEDLHDQCHYEEGSFHIGDLTIDT